MGVTIISTSPPVRQWVNPGRTVLVRLWANGEMEICTRPDAEGIWGPPVHVLEEKVA